jgi:hypothetical protein
MTITKSNKHKLSLDQDKPNEKGGYTLATPYPLMRSLILYYQISITPLGACSLLHSKVFPQLNKWARELSWTRSIYTPHFKTYPLGSNSTYFGVIGRACQSGRTRPISSQRLQCISLSEKTVTVTRPSVEFGLAGPGQ